MNHLYELLSMESFAMDCIYGLFANNDFTNFNCLTEGDPARTKFFTWVVDRYLSENAITLAQIISLLKAGILFSTNQIQSTDPMVFWMALHRNPRCTVTINKFLDSPLETITNVCKNPKNKPLLCELTLYITTSPFGTFPNRIRLLVFTDKIAGCSRLANAQWYFSLIDYSGPDKEALFGSLRKSS